MKASDYLTVSDIKDYLNISQSAAYALTKRNDFPICRFGGAIRIPKKAFLLWVEAMTTIPKNLRVKMNAA